jgi:hypothetical protein
MNRFEAAAADARWTKDLHHSAGSPTGPSRSVDDSPKRDNFLFVFLYFSILGIEREREKTGRTCLSLE